MPCNPIHKQIKRSSSRSFGRLCFVREREYGWEFMENNHKSAGEKNSAPYVPKAFFP